MLGNFIMEKRKNLDISQGELASALGITRPTYNKIENGERELTLGEAQKLSEIFQISLEDLIAGRESKYNVVLPSKTGKDEIEDETGEAGEVQIRVEEKNLEKFKQVLLYVLREVGSRPNVGETVLHKLLYFIDFDYFEKFEENLMGATYIKNHYGPTASELGKIIKEMEENDEIEKVKSQHFQYEQTKYLPLKNPDLSLFTAQEIEHINGVLARLADKSAAELTSYSHGDLPWLAAEDGKPISYGTVFYRDDHYSVRSYDDEL